MYAMSAKSGALPKSGPGKANGRARAKKPPSKPPFESFAIFGFDIRKLKHFQN